MPLLVNISWIATWVWFIFTGLFLAYWDLREHRLPNRLVASALVGALVGFVLVAGTAGMWGSLVRAFIAGLVVFAVYLVIHFLGGMGMGDVKYSLVIGMYLGWLGWEALWWGTLASFVLASIAVFIGMIMRRRSSHLPFGPFMTVGVLIAAVLPTA